MESNNIIIEGMTAVSAVINAINGGTNNRQIYKIYVTFDAAKKKFREMNFLKQNASSLGFDIDIISTDEFNLLAQGTSHGGIAALCSERMFEKASTFQLSSNGIFALLDGIEDPYNYAYTVRSLYAAGFDGIVLPPRNWASADALVAKSSAGTSELITTLVDDPVVAVTTFKKAGYKIASAGIRNAVSLRTSDLSAPLLLIIGGEKRGISRSLLDLSDMIVRIDYGRQFMGSLTTSASAAVMAFEIMRQNQ